MIKPCLCMIETLPNPLIDAMLSEEVLTEIEHAALYWLESVREAPSSDVMEYLFNQIASLDESNVDYSF